MNLISQSRRKRRDNANSTLRSDGHDGPAGPARAAELSVISPGS
jgi:hypothetical protein